MELNRPDIGIIFSRGPDIPFKQGYVHLDMPLRGNYIMSNHHSLAIMCSIWPLKVKTGLSLINLVVSDMSCVRVTQRSPYLASLGLSSYFRTPIVKETRNLAIVDLSRVRMGFFGLRHIRLVRVSCISCRLSIKPVACLEILSMPNAYGPMLSTSGPLRLLVTFDVYASKPSVSHVRKNREPVMTIRNINSVVRHEPCIVRIPRSDLNKDGLLLEKKRTVAKIVPPFRTRKRQTELIGSNRYLAYKNILKPMCKIFSDSPWVGGNPS